MNYLAYAVTIGTYPNEPELVICGVAATDSEITDLMGYIITEKLDENPGYKMKCFAPNSFDPGELGLEPINSRPGNYPN